MRARSFSRRSSCPSRSDLPDARVDDWRVDLNDYADAERSAMMRTTGFSAAIIGGMVARGEVLRKGALLPERDLDPVRYVDELRARGFPLVPVRSQAAPAA
jgi:saccharopine dehydrogenase-like NADP-dependent oxidoreductase